MKHPFHTRHQIDVQPSSYSPLRGLEPTLKTNESGRMVGVNVADDHKNNPNGAQPMPHNNSFAASRIERLVRFNVGEILMKLHRLRVSQATQLLLLRWKIETGHGERHG